MYCTAAVVVDTVHSCPSSAQKNWSIFGSFTPFLVAWSTSYGAVTRLTALISGVPALISG